MGIVRTLVTIECDRCARQQTSLDPLNDDWVIYKNVHLETTVTFCPACRMFFHDFMQGETVRSLR